MKYLLIVIAVALLPLSAFAQEVYSANGFKCNKNETLVMCGGKFPNVRGTFGAIGASSVIIKYEYQNYDFQYDSLQGCLIIGNREKKKIEVTNRKGKKKTFKSAKKAMNFCRAAK